LLLVARRPPVAEIAIGIELAALVVEPVGEFVTNDRANGAEVQRVISLVVVKRRLQNSRRKRNVVLGRVVGSVDRHGRIRPLSFIERFADLVQPPLHVVLIRALRIAE